MNQSVRFFPHWDQNSTDQVIGLIEMINYVFSINTYSNQNWLEIGSYLGESSTLFLGYNKISKLELVEIESSFVNLLKLKHQKYILSNRCLIYHDSSANFAHSVPDNHFDLVYIDGEHDYDNVKNDIDLYFRKVKSGGFLSGHDYWLDNKWPGVNMAVEDFVKVNDIVDIQTFRDSSWLIRKV